MPGIKDQWGLSNNLSHHVGDDFLAVTVHDLADYMRPQFQEFSPLGDVTISPGPEGSRIYRLYIARGYRGG